MRINAKILYTTTRAFCGLFWVVGALLICCHPLRCRSQTPYGAEDFSLQGLEIQGILGHMSNHTIE
jgi:hypothetical protein